MKHRRTIKFVVIALIAVLYLIRFYQVNKGQAHSYKVEEVQIGESIQCDQLKFTVKAFILDFENVEYNMENVPRYHAELELDVENTSDEDVDISAIKQSKLFPENDRGIHPYEIERLNEFDREALAPGETASVLLKFNLLDSNDSYKDNKVWKYSPTPEFYSELNKESWENEHKYYVCDFLVYEKE